MDKFRLYTAAFQLPRKEANFLRSFASGPLLREDFCGTGAISHEWVKIDGENRAIGIDIDGEAIRTGRQWLKEADDDEIAGRVELRVGDSITTSTPDVDIVLVPNSSVFLINKRESLCQYLRSRLKDLVEGGIIVIDIFGGPGVYGDGCDRNKYEYGYYIWEQRGFDARTNEVIAHIHFETREEGVTESVFEYPMRIWGAPELGDALRDVGFTGLETYLGAKRNHVLRGLDLSAVEAAKIEEWEAYIVARKPYH